MYSKQPPLCVMGSISFDITECKYKKTKIKIKSDSLQYHSDGDNMYSYHLIVVLEKGNASNTR